MLLLALLSIALLRGSVVGSVAGFFGGLLVDVLTLDTLGVSALLYALSRATGRGATARQPAATVRRAAADGARRDDRDRVRRLRTPLPARRGALRAPRSRDAAPDPRAQPRGREARLRALPLGAPHASVPGPRYRGEAPGWLYSERRSPSGRFLPPDPKAAEPYRFTPQLALRVGVLAGLALIIFAILFLRLWALQVLSGDRYLNAAQNNQLRTIRVEAQRGSIVDRSGRTIVSNVPGTAVRIWTADLPEEGRYAMFKRLSKILRVPLPRLTKALEESKGDPLTPILVKTAVHEDQVATLLEHRADFPGVEITSTYLRDYEHKALAARLLGYVGGVSRGAGAARSPRIATSGGEKIGKTGVEAAFDSYLRGSARGAQLRVDSLGQPLGPFETRRPAQSGYNIRLTLDVGLQRAAERALRDGIELAYRDDRFNANGGAIVALDPRDGAVLAMASNPTYKPSVYVGRADRRSRA